ncbi:MAG: glycosyltransferase [Chloroflexota bacterium]
MHNQQSLAALEGVSIIIPTYQGAAYLDQTLSALRSQDYPAPLEIVAIDSGSTDGSLALLQKYDASITAIPNEHFSHGYSRNLGIRKAQYPILVFLSQDALPVGTDWLRKLVETVNEPGVGAAYARQVPHAEATPLETFFHLELYPPRSMLYRSIDSASVPLDRIFFSNVCSIARREVCLAHLFDETLIMSEDQAFSKALLTAGYNIAYNADVWVIHSHKYDLKTLFRRNFDSAYSLCGVSEDTWRYVVGKGLRYIFDETVYVIRERQWRWLLFIPVYESTRILGRVLGRYADRMPLRWRETLSLHRQYWLRDLPDSSTP